MANDVLTAFYGKCAFGISPHFAVCSIARGVESALLRDKFGESGPALCFAVSIGYNARYTERIGNQSPRNETTQILLHNDKILCALQLLL